MQYLSYYLVPSNESPCHCSAVQRASACVYWARENFQPSPSPISWFSQPLSFFLLLAENSVVLKSTAQGPEFEIQDHVAWKKKIIKKKGNTNHTYCLFSTRNMEGYLLILFPILFPKALFGILEKEYWVKQNFAQVQYDHLCSLAQIREKQSPDFLPSLVPKHEIKTKNKNYHHGNTGFILYGYFQRHSCLSALLLRNVSLNPGKLTVLLKK